MTTTSSFAAEGTTQRRKAGRKDRDEKKAEPLNGNRKYLSDSRDSGGRAPSERTFCVRSRDQSMLYPLTCISFVDKLEIQRSK
jgi:hypothetical protein